MLFRKPVDNDYKQIFYVLDRAFAPSVSESTLVRGLKATGKISFDFVIERSHRVLAYICYTAAYDNEKNRIGYYLAPLAVLPGWQRRGLGKRIVEESLKTLGKDQPVYVLGDPDYYKRFGFRLDKTQKSRFDPEARRFMTLSHRPLPSTEVLYEEEFSI